MENPFDTFNAKIDHVNKLVEKLLALIEKPEANRKIPFKDFCTEHNISRPTGYSWADKGLITLERVGGRLYVDEKTITVNKKYQRERASL